jgi:hypothetical protein
MSVELLLNQLEGVRPSGGKGSYAWTCKCPAHDDKSPSLSVKAQSDGVILIHCFGGCDPLSVLHAVGLTFEDLYPERLDWLGDAEGKKRVKRPFSLSEAFEAVRYEALLVAECAKVVAKGEVLEPETIEVLTAAANKIELAWGVAHA